MKKVSWVHTADLHLGKPLHHLRSSEEVYRRRESEYRQTFQRLIQWVEQRKVPFLFIAGDFLEYGYVDLSLWEFVQEQIESLTATQVMISPGNHDPYRTDSVYQQETWPDHVHIFSARWEEFYDPEYDLQIVGRGFADFYERAISLPVDLEAKGRRVMITHGDLLRDEGQKSEYFPLPMSQLSKLDFSYIALGHIHKAQTYKLSNEQETLLRYPGSPEALNWKETGQRTFTWVQESANGWIMEEIPIQTRTYEQIVLPLSGLRTKEQVLHRLMEQGKERLNGYVMIEMQGMVSPEIEMNELLSWLPEELGFAHDGLFFIDNQTLPSFDLDKLRRQSQMIRVYLDLMEERKRQAVDEEQEQIELAMYKGLEAFVRRERLG